MRTLSVALEKSELGLSKSLAENSRLDQILAQLTQEQAAAKMAAAIFAADVQRAKVLAENQAEARWTATNDQLTGTIAQVICAFQVRYSVLTLRCTLCSPLAA